MADAELEVRANRMDLVARWADDLAHEIKNPLHAMVINLELVKRRAGSGDREPLVDRVEVVEAELHRVHHLVESLLRLVRPWPDATVARVDGVFDDLLPVLLARARVRKLGFEHQPGRARVDMAPGRLALVLLNLVDNAIEATPEGGRITTACDDGEDSVRITIRDTGAGLPDGWDDRAFEPGVTHRPGRSGLGLAMARRLVQQAGGSLELAPAADGPGTIATVTLPVLDAL